MSGDTEDKKCRLCGRADADNEHIFESRDRNLLKKIAAVYSIWITYHDPLPKCICSKCYAKVISTYKNIAQVKKLQSKWIENVQSIEPDNSYIEVLSFLERANIAMKNFIQTNFGERLQKDAIEKLLVGSLAGWKTPPPSAEAVTHEKLTETLSFSFNNTSNNFTDNENETTNSEKHINNDHENGNDNANAEEDDYLPLSKKPKLTIATTPTPTIVKCKYCALKFESLKELAAHQVEHLEIKIPKLFQPKCLNKNFRRGRLISVQSKQSIRCLNCYLVFDDNKCILEHWSKAECDFYCQICGEEFAQSPKLLRDHISEVHGISYRSLKMQRDLAYLNSNPVQQQQQQQIINKPKQQKVESPQKANIVHIKPKVINVNQHLNQPILTTNGMEVTSSTTTSAAAAEGVGGNPFNTKTQQQLIKCRICNRDFRNFKACNSHMRAHKPPYAYNDSEILPDMKADAYMEPEPVINFSMTSPPPLLSFSQQTNQHNNTSHMNSSIPTLTPLNNNLNMQPNNTTPKQIQQGNSLKNPNNTNNCNTIGPSTSNNANNNSSLNNLHSSTAKAPTSTAPRGIRMKFVTRRSDLNGSNASIKVKSLNDLQKLQTNQAVQNLQLLKNIPAQSPPQQQSQQQQHTSVIVNNLQPQPQQPTPSVPRLKTFEPQVQVSPPMTTIIKDEPMEFI